MCCAARRYDIHHAILYHGGYKAVAKELDRQCKYIGRIEIPDFEALGVEIQGFMEEHDLEMMPTINRLKKEQRKDIVKVSTGIQKEKGQKKECQGISFTLGICFCHCGNAQMQLCPVHYVQIVDLECNVVVMAGADNTVAATVILQSGVLRADCSRYSQTLMLFCFLI